MIIAMTKKISIFRSVSSSTSRRTQVAKTILNTKILHSCALILLYLCIICHYTSNILGSSWGRRRDWPNIDILVLRWVTDCQFQLFLLILRPVNSVPRTRIYKGMFSLVHRQQKYKCVLPLSHTRSLRRSSGYRHFWNNLFFWLHFYAFEEGQEQSSAVHAKSSISCVRKMCTKI